MIFVLGALALLATPFLIAMVLQEKASRSYLSSAQARAAAVGARNFGVDQLLRTHEFRERAGGPRPFDDPYADTFDETFVPIDTRRTPAARGQTSANLADYFPQGVTNPQGSLWGLEVEDEQGKLHRRSAPDTARARLEGAVADVAADPQRFFTDYSARPAVWVAPQSIRAVQGSVVSVDDWRVFGKDARIRVTDGTRSVEGFVTLNHDGGDLPLPGAVLLSTGLGGVDPNYAWLELEQRHPVNLNSARLETLQAMFEGVGVRRGQPPLSRDDAARIAQLILDRPLLGDPDFRRLLDDVRNIVSGNDAQKAAKMGAFALNARIPTHVSLKHTEIRQRPDPNDPRRQINYEEWAAFDGEPGLGTVPATWRTENIYLLEASGTINTPAGTVAAESCFREVVSAAPPERMQWVLDNQLDFEEFLHSDVYGLMGNADTTRGYPFGHKVITYPARPWLHTQALPYGESPDPKAGNAGAPGNPPRGLRPAPAKDLRGPSRGNFAKQEHFTDVQSGAEGRLLTGPYQEPTTFPTFQLTAAQVDLLTGGVEFWFKSPGGGDVFLFDLAEDETVNRLACFVRGGELILRVCDASLERMAAEVHAPVTLESDTWYHLGAYWDGTQLGGIALFLDGRPAAGPFVGAGAAAGFAHYDYANQAQGVRIIAELNGDLDPVQNQITLKNGGNFPPTGVVRIGTEAIDYDGASGTTLRNCVRGARGTGPDPTLPIGLPHPSDAKVTIFGYANPIAPYDMSNVGAQGQIDRVTTGGATLAETLGQRTVTTVNKPGSNNPPTPPGISITDVTIPVTPGGTQNFPRSGYILIDSEVIYYAGTTPASFTGCRRGELQTTAAPHGNVRVSLFGFRASSTQGYLSPGIVQIDDEWIAPVQAGPNNYFTGYVDPSGVPVPLQRGSYNTGVAAHAGGARIMPVFAVRDPSCGAEAGPGRDAVTLVDLAGNKELNRVRVVRNRRPGRAYNLVGLEDWVSRAYDTTARLLKFPSGELPSRVPPNFTIGGAQVGPAAGGGGGGGGMMIDELRYHVVNQGSAPLGQPVGAGNGADTLVVFDANWVNSLPPVGGLVVMGDEVIAHRQRERVDQQSGEIRRCERGFLGTPAAVHDIGESVFHLGAIPVAVLSAPCASGARSLSIQGGARGFPQEGYVLVENEVVGFTWNRGASLEMPGDRRGDGILRGCFGTALAPHRNEAIVVAMPFRYWDRYRRGVADSQMTHFQAAKYARGAWWENLTWTEQTRDPNAGIVVQARLDGKPYGWDAPPTNRPGGIFEFAGGAGQGGGKLGASADQIEVRVMFTWRRGSYYPAHSWKRAPTFLRLAVDYEQPTMTLYHEER